MRLVVGLGNPGSAYTGTRHNVGWEAVDQLAVRLGWIGPGDIGSGDRFNRLARDRFDALTMDGQIGGGEKALLLKPTTFMNVSGKSVQAAMAFYQLTPAEIMVVLDDMALPCGKLRIRKGGSSGGHNGLKDIERALGTDQYPRLRIGVDAPPPRVPGRDYVLGRWTPQQRAIIDPALVRCGQALVTWMERGIDAAMNTYNSVEEI